MKKNPFLVFIILCIWFVISFVTNILGPIMPSIINTYRLSLTLAAFLPFSFFLAYGIMSIPAGMIIEQNGTKLAMLLAFGINLIGASSFAFFPIYPMALGSLFLIGIGMAMLQVIINPLMRVSGGEENFAFFSVLGQGVFGLASFISPYFFVYLIGQLGKPVQNHQVILNWLRLRTPGNLSWSALYFIFAIIFLLMFLIISLIAFPKVELKADEKSGSLKIYQSLLKKRSIWLYFFGIMSYVGLEQGLANWMSKFLSTYHGFNPLGAGSSAIAWFWGTMSIGCLVGLVVLKIMDSKSVLKWVTGFSLISVSLALYGPSYVSIWAFPISGFCISLIFSIIFSLGLNTEILYHGSVSGIYCTGIFGGALVPLIIGSLGDHFGLRFAMSFLYFPLIYILCIGFWAQPLIDNKIISLKDYFKKPAESFSKD